MLTRTSISFQFNSIKITNANENYLNESEAKEYIFTSSSINAKKNNRKTKGKNLLMQLELG